MNQINFNGGDWVSLPLEYGNEITSTSTVIDPIDAFITLLQDRPVETLQELNTRTNGLTFSLVKSIMEQQQIECLIKSRQNGQTNNIGSSILQTNDGPGGDF